MFVHIFFRFLSDNVYDVSEVNSVDEIPTIGKYDGDTSIYCPVRFANGKMVIGSKKYMAVYQNRYYYMSSFNNLKGFISNPKKYVSFISPPKVYPKPKLSLLCPFGFNSKNIIKSLLDTFDLTLVDSTEVFKQKILPDNMPMLGKMYEEPTLKKIMNTHFVSGNQKDDYIKRLRKYIDLESAELNDEDFIKMSSFFFHDNEKGILYKNFPRNVTELRYLQTNEISPDLIIRVVGDEHKNIEQAKREAIKNWITYQSDLTKKIIARDDELRKNTLNKRSTLFKEKLIEINKQKQMLIIKNRIELIIQHIALETINGSNTEKYNLCNSVPDQSELSNMSKNSFTLSALSKFEHRFFELNLRQKKIVINYGLSLKDILGIDDFEVLEQIDQSVKKEIPEEDFLISKCFYDSLKIPTDATIREYLSLEQNSFVDMQKFSEFSNIPWITISDKKLPASILSNIYSKFLVNREGVFEKTFDVDWETSENMLRAGEVYLSKFGHWCPVQVYEKPVSVQQFYTSYLDGSIYPVIHRKYLYFLNGSENRDKFSKQPLKYILQPFLRPTNFPLKLAVLGPPKSGKSYYAKKLCAQYGLKIIQIEKVVKSYLTDYRWVDRTKSSIKNLYNGDCLSDVMLMEVVKSAMQSTQAIIQGFVLDGFPTTKKQFELLNDSGIILHRIFILNSSYEKCLQNKDRSNDLPASLLSHRYQIWTDLFVSEKWISRNFGNATKVDDFDGIENSVLKCVESLREYYKNMYENKSFCLANIPVTKRELKEKMSMYLDLCPICKVDDGLLNRPKHSQAFRENMVQYQSYFYWVCSKHLDTFLGNSKKYADLTPMEPERLPEIITNESLLCNPYVQFKYFSEYCVVCALKCLWNPIYRRGNHHFMVKYSKYTFAFCSAECQDRFMKTPLTYSKYAMNVIGPEQHTNSLHKKLTIDNLPIMGYLEQTIAAPTSRAMIKLTTMKPIYPGLSAKLTAMVFLGLQIGMHGSDDDINNFYEDVFKDFIDTCYHYKDEIIKLKLFS